MKKTSVLFVCLGNICRSPSSQGVFETLVEQRGYAEQIHIDSAGTHAYHVGEQPDSRARQAASKRGIDLSKQRARKVKHSDFDDFDYIIAMDRSNYADLTALCQPELRSKVHLFMSFAPAWPESEVPDPYYGGHSGFERVFDMVEAASEGLLADIIERC